MDTRIEDLLNSFHGLFGQGQPVIYSAPGRTEIGGNHTDHQHGRVLAGSVNVDMLAAAAENGSSRQIGGTPGARPYRSRISWTYFKKQGHIFLLNSFYKQSPPFALVFFSLCVPF